MTAAIYCRLSKEDEEHRQESESIQNQKTMLVQYALERGWEIYDIYVDDDYSGTDLGRPQFNRMLRDAESRRFDIVLVKTQSRFTRDMECVERYIHGRFAEWGIRFVSMVDNADTEVKGNKKARQINGLVNEWYLEDLSDSVRAVLDSKRKNGQFIGSFCCYGYQKDARDHNRLIVDEQAAEVVKKIYSLALQGNGKKHIAKILNQEAIPNPSAYKRQQGLNFRNGRDTCQHGMWCAGTVGRILKDPVYTGVLIQGKYKRVSYKSKKMARQPESEWFVSKNNHEPIIEPETYELVQRMMAARPRAAGGTGQVYSLAGMVYCGECGSMLHRCRGNVQRDGRSASYLRCKIHALRPDCCSNHAIRLDCLTEEVLRCLQEHIRTCFAAEQAEQRCLPDTSRRQARIAQERQRAAAELEQHKRALSGLYLDKVRGVISEEQFVELNRIFLEKQKRLEARCETLAAEGEQSLSEEKAYRQSCERLRRLAQVETLDRELAAEFIERVVVYDAVPEQLQCDRRGALQSRKIVIEWRF